MRETSSTDCIQITDEEFAVLVNFVYKTYGIDLKKKRQLIEGRLYHTLRTKGLTDFSQYLQMLFADKSGEELHHFLNKITTNHSYFARENDHFEFLTQTILPYLEKNRTKELRIWSAGCSAGQEAYTAAMAIDQYFGKRKFLFDTTILATDISSDALIKAKQGIYPKEHLAHLPDAWIEQYFKPLTNNQYQICEAMRKEVIFRHFNLMDPFVFKKPFDLIFCRNVMIYFDSQTTNQLVRKFYQATSEGGFLLIGHSESIQRESVPYTYLRPAVYQKRINPQRQV